MADPLTMPVDLVTLEHVKDRFHRVLTSDEERITTAWIEDSWDDLLDMPELQLAQRLTAGDEPGLIQRIGRTIRASVLRRLQNPAGRRQYSYTVDDATVSETLATETLPGSWFTDQELARLAPAGLNSDAFTIRTDAHLPDVPPLLEEGVWITSLP